MHQQDNSITRSNGLPSRQYKSVQIHHFGDGWQEDVPEDGRTYGYYLIDGYIVPHSFLELLFEHARNKFSEYDQIVSVEDACGADLWDSMSRVEKKMAGPCLMILIENSIFSQGPEGLYLLSDS